MVVAHSNSFYGINPWPPINGTATTENQTLKSTPVNLRTACSDGFSRLRSYRQVVSSTLIILVDKAL